MSANSGRSTNVGAACLVALLAALLQLPLVNRSVVFLDEGQMAAIAARLADGETLYRDVYTGLFPGIYWLAEALFRFIARDLVVLRWAELVINAATSALLFVLARRAGCGGFAWLLPLLQQTLLALSFPAFAMLSYSALSLLAALAALVFACRYVEAARLADGIALGSALAASVVVKQNFGALALVAMAVALPLLRRQGALASMSLPRIALPPVAAGLVVAALAALRLAAGGAWPAFVASTGFSLYSKVVATYDQPLPPVFGAHPSDAAFLFLYAPGALFGAMLRGEPWASPQLLSLLLRLGYATAYAGLAAAAFLLLRSRTTEGAALVATRLVSVFALVFFLGIFPTAIWSHLVAVLPPLLLTLLAAVAEILRALRRRQPRLAAAAGWLSWGVAAVAACYAALAVRGLRGEFPERLDLVGASVWASERDATLYRAADAFLRDCATPKDRVFVLPDMPLLYLTSGRRNATPYDLVIPGDVSEDRIVDGLRAHGVRCIVFNPKMYIQFPDFDRLFPRLHLWLREHFVEAGSVRVEDTEWKFLRRRAPALAGGGARGGVAPVTGAGGDAAPRAAGTQHPGDSLV